jgi:tol-pal system protein YbgF
MKIVKFTNTAAVLVLAGLFVSPVPSRAAAADNKAQTRLEVELQELQDTVARLQQTSDERWALTKNSLDQNADTMNKIAASLATINQQLAAASESGKSDQLTAQVQSVHDSIDEVKARLGRLEKQLNDMAAAQQNLQSQPAGAPGAGASLDNGRDNSRPAPQQAAPAAVADAGPPAYVPPAKDLYQSAYRDYTGAHYTLAAQEFTQLVQAYPQDELAANAQFYIGEIAYHQGQYREAAKAYDAVLQNYPGSPKTAAAQLQKGDSLIQIGQRADGIRELRAVVLHYPQSPESVQARSTLNGMGVTPTPKPSPVRSQ